MLLGKKTLLTASLAFAFALVTRNVVAQDLKSVLAKLDAAAPNFHSTSADFQFDSYQTDPVPDKEVQKGTVYYARRGSDFQMAAHIDQENDKPVPKIYTFSKGVFRLYEKLPNQVTTYKTTSSAAIFCLASEPAEKSFRKNGTSPTVARRRWTALRLKSWNWYPRTRQFERIF